MAMDELRSMMTEQLVDKSFNDYVGSLLLIGHMGTYSMTADTFNSAPYRDRGSPLRNLLEMGLVASEFKRDSGPVLQLHPGFEFYLTEKGKELEKGIKEKLGKDEYEKLIKSIYEVLGFSIGIPNR